jgi:hypothetical protein
MSFINKPGRTLTLAEPGGAASIPPGSRSLRCGRPSLIVRQILSSSKARPRMPLALPIRAALLAIAALAAAAPAEAADAPQFAWGKAGVAYEAYREQAYQCAMAGFGSDIADSAPVETLRKATRRLEALDGQLQTIGGAPDPVAAASRYASEAASVRAAARPEKQVQAVKQLMFSVMQQCMIDHGYTRFALTEQQRTQWSALAEAQDRRVFLHKLASDAAVLEQQKQPLAK